jgi:hypothetical protein
MPPRDPDENLVVVFKTIPMENPAKTLIEGRPIFDDVEVCEIKAPGCKDIKHFPPTFFSHWAGDPVTGQQRKVSYAERFAHQFRQFKQRVAQTVSGTPLDHAPFLTDARRAEMRALNLYTVEQLAAIDGQELKNLGPGGREFKNRAQEYITESKSSAPNKRLEAELEALRSRNALLEEDMAALRLRHEQAEGEFDAMTSEQLRDYITANTGQPPQGNISRKTLARMAMAVTDK